MVNLSGAGVVSLQFTFISAVQDIALVHDGKLLAAAIRDSNCLRLIDMASLEVRQSDG